MATIAQVEAQIALRLPELLREVGVLPDGYEFEVRLYRGDRKKRSNADFDKNWDPDGDSIRIEVLPLEEKVEIATPPSNAKGFSPDSLDGRLLDVLRALDRAEQRPGYEFVALKWFRDTALLHDGFSWADSAVARDEALRVAIDRRLILTSKIANPRPPNFPVTAIRLNRQLPEVAAAIGSRSDDVPGFRPITIRGETLSETVLRERR